MRTRLRRQRQRKDMMALSPSISTNGALQLRTRAAVILHGALTLFSQRHQRRTSLYTSNQLRLYSHMDTPRSNALPSLPPASTIFSGIQPTGIPHLGNYFGALKNWVTLQNASPDDTKLFFSVVDLHAITLPQAREQLRIWRRQTMAALLAVGLNEERSTIFFQSAVPAHAELMWILSCTASMGYLSRMTQWKSKLDLPAGASPLEKGKDTKLKLGLFSYPVLQAADILVHGATHVPVGQDQSQHLEFARECVTNFNHAYGEVLVEPHTLISPINKLQSLTSPDQKMSKSHPSAASRILLTDSPAIIEQKLLSAMTDSINYPSYDPSNRPAVANLIRLLSYFDPQGRTAEDLGEQCARMGMRDFKMLVAKEVSEGLRPIREEYERLTGEDEYLDGVAQRAGERARESADKVMGKVKEAVGL